MRLLRSRPVLAVTPGGQIGGGLLQSLQMGTDALQLIKDGSKHLLGGR